MPRKKYTTVDEFVSDFEGVTRERLEKLREIIKKELPPGAIEKISYNIPSFTLDPAGKGYLVYYAGYAHHVSLYPVPHDVPLELAKEISVYQKGKGTLQFPHNAELPLGFIRRVLHHLMENYRERNH